MGEVFGKYDEMMKSSGCFVAYGYHGAYVIIMHQDFGLAISIPISTPPE